MRGAGRRVNIRLRGLVFVRRVDRSGSWCWGALDAGVCPTAMLFVFHGDVASGVTGVALGS